jgi:hypothetical protein
VVDLTEEEPQVIQLEQEILTILDEREISALPLPGKVIVPDSSLVSFASFTYVSIVGIVN